MIINFLKEIFIFYKNVDSSKTNALKRVEEEYRQLNISPLVNFCITVALFNDEYLFEWKCTILGLKDTPYFH